MILFTFPLWVVRLWACPTVPGSTLSPFVTFQMDPQFVRTWTRKFSLTLGEATFSSWPRNSHRQIVPCGTQREVCLYESSFLNQTTSQKNKFLSAGPVLVPVLEYYLSVRTRDADRCSVADHCNVATIICLIRKPVGLHMSALSLIFCLNLSSWMLLLATFPPCLWWKPLLTITSFLGTNAATTELLSSAWDQGCQWEKKKKTTSSLLSTATLLVAGKHL